MALDIGISNFTDAFKDGLRPNLFYVTLKESSTAANNVKQLFNNIDIQFFCKAASLPASTIGSVEVPFMGRSIKVAGNRTFEDWTITIYNAVTTKTVTLENDQTDTTTTKNLRVPFEKWMSFINSHDTNKGYNRIADYKLNADIQHLDQKGNVINRYRMVGIFPTEVSSIDLAWDSNDTIEEFTVTFALGEYWLLGDNGYANFHG